MRRRTDPLLIGLIVLAVVLAFIALTNSRADALTQADINYHAHVILAGQQAERDAAAAEAHRLWHVEQDRLAELERAAAAKAREDSRVAAPRTSAPAGNVGGILARIRGCESGSGPSSAGDYGAKNPRSSASGAYQFLDSTWRSVTGLAAPASAHPPSVQDAAAARLYASSGTTPWNASRGCWS